MSSLKQALDRIDLWLDTHQTWFAQNLKRRLRPGITRQQVNNVLGDLSYFLPEEIYELYKWHDGEMEVGYFSGSVWICSIGSVYDQIRGGALIESPYFPFILADEYGAYVVRGDEQKGSDFSPVYYYSKDQKELGEIVSPSIENIMSAIAECLETYGLISATQAALSDDRFANPDPSTAGEILNSLQREYDPLFGRIYQKYGLDGIWG